MCRDFFWIAPLAAVLANIGTFLVGVVAIVGLFQYQRWRSEAKLRAQAEVAQTCLIAGTNADEALRSIRALPWGRGLPKRFDDKLEYYEYRYRQVFDKNGIFEELRRAEVQQDILIGNNEVSKSFSEFFSIRENIVRAINCLIEIEVEHRETPEAQELKAECDVHLNGLGSDKDELGPRQDNAIQTINEVLRPIARYDRNRFA
ncbi:hypothetical protein [Ruegeria sp. Alg231-54]|uniref:hypothetical protein n=1 Tax=Ruegeria sp. Alg231-54 TaxID=1922221 RepID=UPI000D54BB5D|nr:hypothetical protein [Ruegeria sp. Alg231-54]